jgi:beta-lactamase regulating signal transducer with metallopeptidase domain
VHQLGAVRDAVLALPPIPAALWIGVAAMLLGVVAFRTLRFRRLLARARPAPREVVTMVAGAAEALGVRRAPSTFVVDARISPLVWCGRDLLLLLPADLWSQLDETGRRAVIYHELAHLRRRDHWVSWFGTLIGCLYWWHPVVWWIRRRLREEADLCCDAWVTTLLPGARRAYATALLETKRFTSLEAPAGPAVGLGVTALRARRFARRLTMIMSHQRTPQLTLAGITLAAAVIVIGWLVSPTLACPPDPAEAPTAVQAPRAPKAPRAPRAPKAPRALHVLPHIAPAPRATQPDGTTYEQFIRTHSPGDGSVEQRLEQLEQRLDRLAELLESRFGGAAVAPRFEYRVETMPAPLPEELDAARRAYEGALMDVQEAPVAPGQVYWKKYELPKRKLAALTELMSREDVPILIRPGDGYIEVQGNDQTHRIFKAFCVMINGEDLVREYKLPKGKLEGMIELMRLEDVPILIEIGDDRIGVHGTTLEQAVFAAFTRLIAPEHRAQGEVDLTLIAEALVLTESDDVREHLLGDFEVEHDGVHAHMDALHAQLAEVHERMAMSEAFYERMLEKAENLEEEGDQLEEEADDLEDLLEEMEEREEMAKAASVRAKIAAMLASAERVWAEAEEAEAAADQHEDEYDALEELADELEEQIEELQELLEELREQMMR